MKIDLFKSSIYIDNIDSSKINIENIKFEKTWFSETKSSHNFKNNIDEISVQYLLKIVANLLKKDIQKAFNLELTNIWQNNYEKNDFQERHIHTDSHFSFVIYKKIKKSKTLFFNPAYNLISSFYKDDFINKTSFFELQFQPKCRENQIVVFPSYLEHMVKKNDDAETISGNMLIEISE